MKLTLRTKAFALVFLIALVLSAFAVIVTYSVHDNTMNNHYKTMTLRLSKSEALMVDPELLDAYGKRVRAIYDAYCDEHGDVPDLENMSEEEQDEYLALFEDVYAMEGYELVQQGLSELAKVNEVQYMYINLWDEERGTVIYLMDGSVKGELTPIGWVEQIEAENLKKIRSGDYELDPYITNYEEYGWLCTATSCITAKDGRIVAHAYVDISMNEVKAAINQFLFNITLMLFVLSLGMIIVSLVLVNKILVAPIKRMSRAAYLFVSARKLNENIFGSLNIKSKDEVGQLSRSMQNMEAEINEYIVNIQNITAEKERIGAELNVATQIQADMLPSIFPAFPSRKEFDIYASMDPAKEVGGDFYDFFLVDDNHLALVMADVSGKGMPAALFMVIAKTLIKNRAQAGGSPAEILRDVNEQLCEGNKAQLFVTVWLAILDITTGKGVAANAGHEDPVVRRANGEFELVKYRHSPAVAVMEGVRFRQHDFELHPGDTLYVYTDGVPEATNAEDELYGTDRMLAALNRHKGESLESILNAVREDIDAFVGSAPQFDDITMLGLDYYGGSAKISRELKLVATAESLNDVNAFIEGWLEELEAAPKASMQLMVALEELFVNIAHYAYAPGHGDAFVKATFDSTNRMFTIELKDCGTPFDPLAKEDPDITLPAEERPIGGLGIYMVKKSMDVFNYERSDNMNIVTFGKKI